MRPDDDIALDIGRQVLAWIRNPVGARGVSSVMGDGTWGHGYDVTVSYASVPKCRWLDCERCRG